MILLNDQTLARFTKKRPLHA